MALVVVAAAAVSEAAAGARAILAAAAVVVCTVTMLLLGDDGCCLGLSSTGRVLVAPAVDANVGDNSVKADDDDGDVEDCCCRCCCCCCFCWRCAWSSFVMSTDFPDSKYVTELASAEEEVPLPEERSLSFCTGFSTPLVLVVLVVVALGTELVPLIA